MKAFDPIELAVFKSATRSVAEEMGASLRRTAFSPNIKERRDYSCAVFDSQGQAIAMGDHMPVHLGSMPMSVRAAVDALALGPGDIAMLNDPFAGGTHLPDITLVAPVFIAGAQASRRSHENRKSEIGNRKWGQAIRGKKILHPDYRLPITDYRPPDFFVASRAHHADIGGAYAGSMGLFRDIYQEGL